MDDGAITKTDERASFETYDAIAATLQRYIDGARTGDGALMRTAFLGTARIRGSYGGRHVDWALSDFCALIDKHGPAADMVARIVMLDVSGPAAAARLEAENWRNTRYSDFFVLLRVDAGWLIASKVFFAHSRA
jgi:hypothetical protein